MPVVDLHNKTLMGAVPLSAVYFEIHEKIKIINGIDQCYKASVISVVGFSDDLWIFTIKFFQFCYISANFQIKCWRWESESKQRIWIQE